MADSLIDKLKKIKDNLATPPSLSTVEVEKITQTFEAMKEILDETLEDVLEKDRVEAFRYTNLLVQALQQADTNFQSGVPVEERDETNIIAAAQPAPKSSGPVKKPDFNAFRKNLTSHQLSIASRLDCFKDYEEVGDTIVCNDCSMENMIACIRREDPTIDPNKDFELDVKMIRKNQNKP